jgi:hypothetical protein
MARGSADIPHSMRKVYRRFERWRSATQPACRFRSAWRKMGDSGRAGADDRPAGVLRQKKRFAKSRSGEMGAYNRVVSEIKREIRV